MALIGVHKQIVNRIIEPYLYTSTVLSSTYWDNFFELRLHEDAQPEFFELASVIDLALSNSTPKILSPGEWHLPYITQGDKDKLSLGELIKVSTARCCRVSYLKHDGSNATLREDIDLHDKLVASKPRHSSPAEHQATPATIWQRGFWNGTKYCGNFNRNWVQYRKVIELGKERRFGI